MDTRICNICSISHSKLSSNDVVLMSLLLTLNMFYTLFWFFHRWLCTNKCRMILFSWWIRLHERLKVLIKLRPELNLGHEHRCLFFLRFLHDCLLICFIQRIRTEIISYMNFSNIFTSLGDKIWLGYFGQVWSELDFTVNHNLLPFSVTNLQEKIPTQIRLMRTTWL